MGVGSLLYGPREGPPTRRSRPRPLRGDAVTAARDAHIKNSGLAQKMPSGHHPSPTRTRTTQSCSCPAAAGGGARALRFSYSCCCGLCVVARRCQQTVRKW